MPVFHTKTIESILEPVAQQVSRLVILHEEAEDGNAMPDLEKPVLAVSKAVVNLIKVGRETINSSDDQILRQDMPVALQRVERASKLLEEASAMLKVDPYSQPARKKLIEGARGILQGTSALLLCFDESEVRKIIRECKRVLDYLAVAEVIETIDDLVQFVKDLSPCLTKVSRDVDAREKELTHQVHRETLIRSLDSVKTLAPVLICGMKIHIQLLSEGKKTNEAAENRNYLVQRMTDEINEIIRVLQLTTYDEDEWEADNLTSMKKAESAINGKLQACHDWLEDPTAVVGGLGEKSLRSVLDHAAKIAERALPPDRDAIIKMCGDITSLINALCELRANGQGTSPQAQSLSRGIAQKLKELKALITRAIQNMERSGVQQPAHTVGGRIEQAQKWLSNPGFDDKGVGQQAIQAIVDEGRKLANFCPPAQRHDILQLCNEVESLNRQLADFCRRGQGNSPQAQEIAKNLSQKLKSLQKQIEKALVTRVVDDFIDITTPLKQFTDAVLAPEGTPNREYNFQEKSITLSNFSDKTVQTARNVASGSAANKRVAEGLLNAANHVESLTPQLVNAGRIRLNHPENLAAQENFENLRKQYADSLQRMRNLVDEACDTVSFIKASEEAILKHTQLCENSIINKQPQSMVDNASTIARLTNRVIMVAKQETDNSEDPHFVHRVTSASNILESTVPPMVQAAKEVALNITDPKAISRWREANKTLVHAVGDVRKAVEPEVPDLNQLHMNDVPVIHTHYEPHYDHDVTDHFIKPEFNEIFDLDYKPVPPPPPSRPAVPPPSLVSNYQPQIPQRPQIINVQDYVPPRPPLPTGDFAPPRPPLPEEDDYDDRFPVLQPNQPIMMAAHDLHQEVRQWSSKENEIIAAAKKMALKMAKLSQLVRGEGGSKKDLIDCAKSIAEASEEVTRLAKEQAKLCTDKRMRTNILQVCERIPTIGTQLRILSTVKATMLGAQGTDEDQEATDMLVGNAQNLMQSVKETVRACEAASIKIRTDSGVRIRWVRKQPWYQLN